MMKANRWINGVIIAAVLMGQTAICKTPIGPEAGAAMLVRLGDRLMQVSRDVVSHDFRDAEKAYMQALELEPANPDALVGMAWVKSSEHNFSEGKSWAVRALEVRSNQKQAYALLADGAMELGAYDEAFEYVQKALDIQMDLSSLSRASHLLWITGDPTRAKEMMGNAIRAGGPFPENVAWCRSELALMHFYEGQTDEAKRQVEMAIKIAPANPRVLNMLGRLHAADGELEKAIKCYEKSVSVTLMHESLAALVELYELDGDVAKYHRQIEAVLNFHRGEGHSHHHSEELAHVHGNAELARFMADREINLGDALEEAEQAFESYPNVKSADTLAWCHYKNGRLEDALKFSQMALKWNSPFPEFHFHHGMILMKMGRVSEGRIALGKALKMNPQFDPSESRVARLAMD